MRVRKVKDIEKIKTGRIEKKYSYKNLAKFLNFHHIYFTSLKKESKETEELLEVLAVGTIVYLEEKDNKEEFERICNLIKKEPIVFERTDFTLPKQLKKVDEKFVELGLNFMKKYGLNYDDLSELFRLQEAQKQHDEKFFRYVEDVSAFPREVFIK